MSIYEHVLCQLQYRLQRRTPGLLQLTETASVLQATCVLIQQQGWHAVWDDIMNSPQWTIEARVQVRGHLGPSGLLPLLWLTDLVMDEASVRTSVQ